MVGRRNGLRMTMVYGHFCHVCGEEFSSYADMCWAWDLPVCSEHYVVWLEEVGFPAMEPGLRAIFQEAHGGYKFRGEAHPWKECYNFK